MSPAFSYILPFQTAGDDQLEDGKLHCWESLDGHVVLVLRVDPSVRSADSSVGVMAP